MSVFDINAIDIFIHRRQVPAFEVSEIFCSIDFDNKLLKS